MAKEYPSKGTCWYVDLGDTPEFGDVLYKTRPCIIVSDNQYNRHSECLTVVPVVSRTKKVRNTHAVIDESGIKGIAKAEQMRTISRSQLRGYKGTISPETMMRVCKSIAYHLFSTDIHQEADNKLVVELTR
jgi:mRNA interferase MazF